MVNLTFSSCTVGRGQQIDVKMEHHPVPQSIFENILNQFLMKQTSMSVKWQKYMNDCIHLAQQ